MNPRVGVTLPMFGRELDPADSIGAARHAEERGLDGVFAFDHLWAIGRPDRPALSCWPLLGAIAATTTRIHIGPLVARVTLQRPGIVAHQLRTLARLAPGRAIAGLGIGDEASRAENEAAGVPFPPLAERLALLEDTVTRLANASNVADIWLGGRLASIAAIAKRHGVARNLWESSPEEVRAAAFYGTSVTWAGDPKKAPPIDELADAGAAWVVFAPVFPDGEDPRTVIDGLDLRH